MTVTPYYDDGTVTLYHGDMRDILPAIDMRFDACVTDMPYGSSKAAWDRWVDGWPGIVGRYLPPSASLWTFGTAGVFLDRRDQFTDAGFKFSRQEALWLKGAGTRPGSRDRLTVVHEWAYHWYRGRWSDLHHEWPRVPYTGQNKGTVRSRGRDAELQDAGGPYTWTDDGTRQPRSVTWVIESPSVRGRGRHPDEKPMTAVMDLVRECTPPGGVAVDPFAGAGTTGVAARMLGRRAVLIETREAACEATATRLSLSADLFTGSTP